MKIYPAVKRCLDLCTAVCATIVASPVLLVTAIVIKLDSPGPVIFRQQRLGRNGKPFWIYKFRSMCQNAEKQGTGVYSYKDDPRLTKVGRFIRATSIDELPQLWNIIKGDMSLIGPRPALTYHPWPFEQYTQQQREMFDVRPGITGWAQVNGRKEVPWPERIELNRYYVHNLSFKLDLKIIWMTIFKVVANEDNYNVTPTLNQQ